MPGLLTFIPVALSSTPPDLGAVEVAPAMEAPWVRPMRKIMDLPARSPEYYLQRRLPPDGQCAHLAMMLLEWSRMPPEAFDSIEAERPADTDVVQRVGDCLTGVIPDVDTLKLDLGAAIRPGDVAVVVSGYDLQMMAKVFLGIEGDCALFYCSKPYAAFAIPLSQIRWAERVDIVPTLPPVVRDMLRGGPWEPPRKGDSLLQAYNDVLVEAVGIIRDIRWNSEGRLPYRPVPGAPFRPMWAPPAMMDAEVAKALGVVG